MLSNEKARGFRPHVVEGAETAPAVMPDDDLWARFAGETSGAGFFEAWLSLQCRQIRFVRTALLLFENEEGKAFLPLAVWPSRAHDANALKSVAEQVLAERRAVVRQADSASGGTQIGYPVEQGGHVFGMVVLDLDTADERAIQEALQRLHWGLGWVEAQVWRHRSTEDRDRLDRSVFALDLLAVASEHQSIEAAAMAVVNELAPRLKCDRVSLGMIARSSAGGSKLSLLAISHTAWFQRKSTTVMELENAMEEALDQLATIAYPPISAEGNGIFVAHKAYAENRGVKAVATFVLLDKGTPVGAMTVERRDELIDRGTVLLNEAVASLIGPVLELKRRQRQWVSGRLVDAVSHGLRVLLGPRRPSIKLAAIGALGLAAFVTFYPGQFQISADAVLEGAEQRAAVAPFDGFVASAQRRAGDVVKRGDVLAELDDKDLKLETQRWKSEYAQLLQEKRKALASFDRAEIALIDAKLEQAKAQIDLTTTKLNRTRIEAPIDGVVISGDLSQKLGTPVQQGVVLFEVAPLSSYRVILKLDERDIRHVAVGQSGQLLLSGRVDEALPFKVSKLTSVSNVENGRNVFRAEGLLDEAAAGIRPGMEGVGKVVVGERALISIWTRRLVDWARLFVWRWTP